MLLEDGPPVEDRFLPGATRQFDPEFVLKGEGGPGFLVDAKLCISPTAGAQFPPNMSGWYPRVIDAIDLRIFDTLVRLGDEVRRSAPNPFALKAATDRMEQDGLELESYPVRPLGSRLAQRYVGSLVAETRGRGVQIKYRSRVKDIRFGDVDRFRVVYENQTGSHELSCDQVVLAVGRSGAQWLNSLSIELPSSPNKLDIGVRLEFPSWGGEQIRELGENPKIKLYDDRSYAKTHCFVHKGRVISYFLDDRCLIDAHATRDDKTEASSMNLLYHFDATADRIYDRVAERARNASSDRPLAMTLADFLGTTDLPDCGSRFAPTLGNTKESDLRLILPPEAVAGIQNLIRRLSVHAPGIATRGSMVYAVSAEWLSPRVTIEPYFRVKGTPGLWCVGDGSGWTSGVLPAAASGIQVAQQIVSRRPTQLSWRF